MNTNQEIDLNEEIPGMGITKGEFLNAYHASTPEIQKKIRQILGLES